MTTMFWQLLSAAVFNRDDVVCPDITFQGRLPGPLAVSELLSEAVALVGSAMTRLMRQPSDHAHVDARLCAFWALTSCRPIGWIPPEPWDPFSAIFTGSDGWIRLHTNAPHHKTAAIAVLGRLHSKDQVTELIARQTVAQLEQQIIEAGGAAAQMITWQDWQNHPQGRAISQSPLVEWREKPASASKKLRVANYQSSRPLTGIRVLDLTRVLAGPVTTRTLAGYGADVMRIDPPAWDDPGLLQDTTVGKRCTGLNLSELEERQQFEKLLGEADILVHGYRPGALAELGYEQEILDKINPKLIEISLSAYGWRGPWAKRRGFDSLVQFSTGIADICSNAEGAPGKLPVQALDHTVGYIMAACCLEALRVAQSGRVMSARTLLARIAWLLCQTEPRPLMDDPIPIETESDYLPEVEKSDWGALKRLKPPLHIKSLPMYWDIPAGKLRRHTALWSEA